MFIKRAKNPESETGLFAKILWRCAWAVQIVLWGFLLFFVLHYWLIEVPAVRSYHSAGLTNGFDGLAGIVASLEPSWSDMEEIHSHPGGSRFTQLQSDSSFRIWRELDEMPTWNAGIAKLCFDQEGKLVWVRPFTMQEHYAENKTDGQRFPIIFSWSARSIMEKNGATSGKARQ